MAANLKIRLSYLGLEAPTAEIRVRAIRLSDAIAAAELREAELSERAMASGDPLAVAEWLNVSAELTALTLEGCELCSA